MSDLLARATRELRDAPVTHDRALLTLSRITQPPRVRTRRRTTRLVALVVPIAATLVALGAWAGAAHERSRTLVAQARTEERVVAHAMPKGIAPLPVPLPTATETAPLPQLPPPQLPPPPPVHVEPHPIATVAVAVSVATPPPPAPDYAALYRRAFEAYRDHDDRNALAGWDAYLAAAGPTGRFVPEARFARAATLVRLGRKDEAREALAPFARGEFGTYRQTEARNLLERL